MAARPHEMLPSRIQALSLLLTTYCRQNMLDSQK